MTTLSFSRFGAGPPLLLLHALGSSRAAWDPVVPALAERFEVIAVDLPGFGASAPLPPGAEPSPAYLAATVAGLLDEQQIDRPHVAGNSLGGWIALELAALRPVATLTLLGPAGLWRRGTPLYCLVSLRITRWASRHAPGLLSRLVGHPLGRILVLGQTHGRPTRVTPGQARTEIEALGAATGFEAALAATAHRHYQAGPALDAPVTVAIGSRDLILLPHQSRHLDQLPPGTRSAALPGCGHIPMSDDPAAVVGLITAAVGRADGVREAPSARQLSPSVLQSESASGGHHEQAARQ
jgi:pimeloyl-ACP methyl ester carboxylesterase